MEMKIESRGGEDHRSYRCQKCGEFIEEKNDVWELSGPEGKESVPYHPGCAPSMTGQPNRRNDGKRWWIGTVLRTEYRTHEFRVLAHAEDDASDLILKESLSHSYLDDSVDDAIEEIVSVYLESDNESNSAD